MLYVPGLILSYMEVAIDFYAKAYIHGSNGWIITARTESIWFWASIIYIIVYFSTNILISLRFQKTGLSQRERKQARLLTITATASLLTGLVHHDTNIHPEIRHSGCNANFGSNLVYWNLLRYCQVQAFINESSFYRR